MERFGGKQSGGSGPGKDDPGKSGSGPGKTPIVDSHGSGPGPSGVNGGSGPSAPVPTAAQAVATFAPLNIAGEVASFGGGGGVAAALVAALPTMTADEDVAKHTIAMFQYLGTHGAALAAKINTDFDVLVEPDKKNAYLLQLQEAMTPKLGGKGLWTGAEERGMMAVGIEPIAPFFQKGKVALLQKATQAQAQNRPLVGLLANVAMNMEAKSYGRRAESMEAVNVAGLPAAAGTVVRPQVGVPFPCNAAHATYLTDDTYQPIVGTALQAGVEYSMAFNGSENLGVTVQSNDGTNIMFSAIV